MERHLRRLTISLCPLVVLAACGPSGQQHDARLLNRRLQATLGPDIAAGNAVLQPLPDGAQVTLLNLPSVPDNRRGMEDQQPGARASVIEGLLDPRLMRIQLADTSMLPGYQRDARVASMTQYIAAYGLASTLQPASAPQAPAVPAPAGLTITVRVQCPQSQGGMGYGDGRSHPVCD